jgi:hypothetical protein
MELAPDKKKRLLQGELLMEIEWPGNDIIRARGSIFVRASPEVVWRMLTDYGNLHHTMPKVVRSELVEERGNVKVIDQTGRSGILIFERSVQFRLQVDEEFPTRLRFTQLEGDFKVYEGEWILEPASNGKADGTLVTYRADIKPDFFAPPFLVSFVQSQDLPAILRSIRTYCEARSAG